ncbi:aminotransferase class III-fold pyridoxal phosphate-dependent enzyme [Actinomadura miaoliensis]|uniref:Aminotransferase class III-fold pyridoxal phosphate-dependent enzyme n=1 Tax=Actinomadura miaoliensis TaxID=430685 RepID=A0ABP7V6N3_9ACTN
MNARAHDGPRAGCVELTTTSTLRPTLIRTYRSFFRRVRHSGCFRVLVTVDPAYPVSEDEAEEVRAFLRDLPRADDRVCSVVVEEFPRHVGLQGALSVLFAHKRAPVGVHLEDDWEFIRDVDLDALVEDLVEQESTQISFASDHVARGGTFDREGEVETVPGTRVPLRRLTAASWAAYKLPLGPHVHQTARWVPTFAKALVLSDPIRCPDERVREHVIAEDSRTYHNALWTEEVVVRDIGRDWLRKRDSHKVLVPRRPSPGGALGLPRDGDVPPRPRSAAYRADERRLLGTPPGRPADRHDDSPLPFLERAEGAVVWDVDGLPYIDLLCGDGAVILGHDHPAVTRTIRERTVNGLALAPAFPARVVAADLVAKAVPGAEAVRFSSGAVQAVRTAADAARRFTGRPAVVAAGPVAWPSGGSLRTSAGADVTPFDIAPLDDVADEERLIDLVAAEGARIAAVLVAGPLHRPLTEGFLRRLRRACHREGTLFMLDEGLTAFRMPGGLAARHEVVADLACLSHGLASGLSAAAVAGRADVVDAAPEDGDAARTGDVLVFEVMKACLREYAQPEHHERLAATGRRLREALDGVAAAKGLGKVVHGHDQMPYLRFTGTPAVDQEIVGELARRGVLARTGPNFVSRAHDEQTVDVVADAFARSLDRALETGGAARVQR